MSFCSRIGNKISRKSCPAEVSYIILRCSNTRPRSLTLRTDMNEDDDHRYMMFSATFDKECRKLARMYLANDHIRIRIGRPGSSHLIVQQYVILPNMTRIALETDRNPPLGSLCGRGREEKRALQSDHRYATNPDLGLCKHQKTSGLRRRLPVQLGTAEHLDSWRSHTARA